MKFLMSYGNKMKAVSLGLVLAICVATTVPKAEAHGEATIIDYVAGGIILVEILSSGGAWIFPAGAVLFSGVIGIQKLAEVVEERNRVARSDADASVISSQNYKLKEQAATDAAKEKIKSPSNSDANSAE